MKSILFFIILSLLAINLDAQIVFEAGENDTSADIRIRAGDNVISSDVRVKIKSSGTVDCMVYIDKETITIDDAVVALLPALNKEMLYEFEDIPRIN